MVFAVNPGPDGSSNSFAAFLAEALQIGEELQANETTITTESTESTETIEITETIETITTSITTSTNTTTTTTVIHQINVSNDTAGLIFDPPYIVRQLIILFYCCADISSLSDCRGWGHRRVYLPSQEPQCDPVKLC